MSFCSHCGNQMEAGDKFCRVCGTAVPEESAPQNVPAPVAVKAEPVISGKVKALGFVGMGLGIGGVVFGTLGVLYTLIGMAMPPMGITFALIFGFFSVPLSIVGRILSYKSIEGGNPSGVCSAGVKLGMAGLIVSAVMLFFGFFSVPLSIVGRILSYKSIEGGNPSGVCSAGVKLGMAGLIVSAVMLFFGFINLINCASYSY